MDPFHTVPSDTACFEIFDARSEMTLLLSRKGPKESKKALSFLCELEESKSFRTPTRLISIGSPPRLSSQQGKQEGRYQVRV